jgi:hypothetical protein
MSMASGSWSMSRLYTLTQRQLQVVISSHLLKELARLGSGPGLSSSIQGACQRCQTRRNDMAFNELIVAISLIASASQTPANPASAAAPPGTSETRYCLRVDPLVGSRVETIQCKTRDEWAALEIDVDQEWAENGVRTIS